MQQAWDLELVEARLLAAGRTLMALHVPGVRPGGYRSGMPEVLQEAIEAYGYNRVRARAAPPQAREIAAMDQALSWIRLLPADRVVMRRIVGARMLCRPEQDRPLLGWRVIAARVGASHEAVRGWHAIALTMIVGRLNAPGCARRPGERSGRRRWTWRGRCGGWWRGGGCLARALDHRAGLARALDHRQARFAHLLTPLLDRRVPRYRNQERMRWTRRPIRFRACDDPRPWRC